MSKVDSYGMTSGIIKVIPPQEWKDSQPKLDELVKQIRVREPIKQDIMGSNGTYRQINILHGRSYNLPQWRQLCDQSEHQPPARRGERRANAEKPKAPRPRPAAAPKQPKPATPNKRGRGRPPKGKGKQAAKDENDRPMTPVSPKVEAADENTEKKPEDKDTVLQSVESVESVEKDQEAEEEEEEPQPSGGRMGGRMGAVKQSKPKTQSVSARRKYSRREGSAAIDQEAFKDFQYKMDISDYTAERCEELERAYWKTLTYAAPLYGADMMGTLFDDRTDIWNLNKLPNLLDVLGTKIPGVNTAYLYLGMWKATFAWHLEDVDLYSINYLHFGAPKQWYSISQADAPRFEKAMKNVWPADAKSCSQFLRHKGYLISPQHLQSHYGIKVNKCLSYPGEFVVTYPYGYHSGYNLGYNCAEAVNFALEPWLPMGKVAKRCECAQAQDSVWIDVYEIERKLRGEPTPVYEETEEEDDDDEDEMSGLPSPPANGVKFKDATRKRKRNSGDKVPRLKVKKIRLRLKSKAEPPCCLCPNDFIGMDLLPTNDGRKAHKMCALFIPETYVDTVDGQEVVCNINNVHKDRLDLKCLFCRSKKGACFQCSQKKCARAYHATCAAAAGVFVEEQDVPVVGEDGTEYKEQAFEFSCRFHRAKRDKKVDGEALENDKRILAEARNIKKHDICQFQYAKGEIFAGMIVENREDEETFLVDIIPYGDHLEVEWKWLFLPDPSDYHLPKASPNAIPLPASQKAKDKLNTKRQEDDKPRKDDVFAEGYTWAEFNLHEDVSNKEQAKANFEKPDQIWHYLGKTSTEARAQYTEDPANPRHNPKGSFLDTIPKPPKPVPAPKPNQHRPSMTTPGQYQYQYQHNGMYNSPYMVQNGQVGKPYMYKPKFPAAQQATPGLYNTQRFAPTQNAVFQQYMPAGQTQPASAAHNQQPAGQYPATPQAQHKPAYQMHSSVYHKYPFFQVNHNRDASRYRTPYAPSGGFTNGYEGNLKAHLMAHPNELMRQHNVTSAYGSSYFANPQFAVKQQYQPAAQPSKPKAKPQPKAYKVRAAANTAPSLTATDHKLQIPEKESPVPLPANFLAALMSSPNTPHAPKSSSPNSSTSPTTPTTATSPSSVKTSNTPVPLPQFATGLPGQQKHGHEQGCMSHHQITQPQPNPMSPPMQSSVPIGTHMQEFADVPGRESMEFVENMMQNLRRASLHSQSS